nr:hypothetical protein BaRGS_034118 [Batillaria attramentaria]
MEGNEMSLEEEIKRWKELTSPSPSAIVLTVRCDVRYTGEEYDIYRQMKKTWGDKAFTRRLVVAFTFGDRQDRDISQELQSVNEELKSVIRDAKGRYADDTEKQVQVQKLLDIVSSMEMMKEDEDGPDHLLRIEIALFVAAVASGICLAAFITKKMHQETAVFAVMCAGFTAALVGTEVYRRLKK